MSTRHGRFAVAILVMQDIAAVVLPVLAKGRRPSPWALLPPLLLFTRPLFGKILMLSGHGELFVLSASLFAPPRTGCFTGSTSRAFSAHCCSGCR